MASQPQVDIDVEMTGLGEDMASDSLDTTPVDDSTVQDADEDVPLPVDNSTTTPSKQGPDDESVDDQQARPIHTTAAALTIAAAVGWGFDLLNSEIQASEGENTSDAEDHADSEDEQLIEDAVAEDVHEQAVDGGIPEDADTQAVDDAVAEDVAAQAAAADRAATQDWLAEQDRWLNQLANENPDGFARLVASGVIDADFVPQRVAARNEDTAAADADDDQDAVGPTDGDGQDNDPAAANHPPLAQPANDGNANPGRSTNHLVWLANRADAGNENTVCPACQTAFSPVDEIVYLDCGHAWCSECLNSNYRSALKNRAHWPPRCCHIDISHESIAYLLEPDLQMDLVVKVVEFDDPSPIYCQTPRCTSGYISADHRSSQWAACQTCHLSTCIECRAPARAHPMPGMHPSMHDIIEKGDKDLADSAGWKQCPGCRNLVERTEGCNHMSCECGHAFCYRCGKTLNNGMPCDCEGEHQWVQEMNAEAVAAARRDRDEDDEDGDEDEDEDERRVDNGDGVRQDYADLGEESEADDDELIVLREAAWREPDEDSAGDTGDEEDSSDDDEADEADDGEHDEEDEAEDDQAHQHFQPNEFGW